MIYRKRFTIEAGYYGYQWHLTDDPEMAHGMSSTKDGCMNEIDEWIEDGEEPMGIDDEPDYDSPSIAEQSELVSRLDRGMRF